MYNRFQLARKYIRYYLTASNGKGHGIHSPFVFEFVERVLNDTRSFYAYTRIERLRRALTSDARVLTVEDFGAGSATGNKKERRVADIARSAVKPRKYGQLLFRMAAYYKPHYILELGTSAGLTSAYLALADERAIVTTIEGSPSIAELARETFRKLGLSSIALYNRPFHLKAQRRR